MVNTSRLKDWVDLVGGGDMYLHYSSPFPEEVCADSKRELGSILARDPQRKDQWMEVPEEKVLVHKRTVQPSHQVWRDGLSVTGVCI